MRIIMIYPDLHIHVNYPLGLGILSAVLKQKGHETRILHFNEEMGTPLEFSTLERAITDFEPQLIAFSSTSNQFQYVRRMADFIKSQWDIPIVVGGIHATISPENVLHLGTVDMICRGEGEGAVLDLVEKMERGEDWSSIDNIGFRNNGAMTLNPLRPLIDLDTFNSLPYPDREGFDFGTIVEKKKGWANVMASRGCLMRCSYCVNHYFRKLYSPLHEAADHLRYRKVDTVLREIEEMVEEYPNITLINLDDDNIVLNREWLEEFCEVYPARVGLPFACNVHPTKFDLAQARKLAKAGCVEVKIGLESGSERIRREVLRRPSKEDVMARAFAAAEEAGIRTWAFNMIGIPTETREEMFMTAALNAKIRPYIIRCSVFFPYEGTDLYDYSLENNLIQEERLDKVSSHLEDTVLGMPQLSREEILRFKTLFKWYVDANSDIEAAPLFRSLISYFEKLPREILFSEKGKEIYQRLDEAVDMLLRELKMEHYATRRHLDLNFTKKLDYELP